VLKGITIPIIADGAILQIHLVGTAACSLFLAQLIKLFRSLTFASLGNYKPKPPTCGLNFILHLSGIINGIL
jgi:hypothetical protein